MTVISGAYVGRGASILITSAPARASIAPMVGPAMTFDRSKTRTPCKVWSAYVPTTGAGDVSQPMGATSSAVTRPEARACSLAIHSAVVRCAITGTDARRRSHSIAGFSRNLVASSGRTRADWAARGCSYKAGARRSVRGIASPGTHDLVLDPHRTHEVQLVARVRRAHDVERPAVRARVLGEEGVEEGVELARVGDGVLATPHALRAPAQVAVVDREVDAVVHEGLGEARRERHADVHAALIVHEGDEHGVRAEDRGVDGRHRQL